MENSSWKWRSGKISGLPLGSLLGKSSNCQLESKEYEWLMGSHFRVLALAFEKGRSPLLDKFLLKVHLHVRLFRLISYMVVIYDNH